MTATAVLARLAASTVATRTVQADSTRVGNGTVSTAVESGALVLREAGTWAPDGTPIRWSAVSRWQAEADALAVEHERQGVPASAVLDCGTDGRWVGRAPHVCGADRYAVSLRADADAVEVAWTISGPEKAARIVTRYTAG